MNNVSHVSFRFSGTNVKKKTRARSVRANTKFDDKQTCMPEFLERTFREGLVIKELMSQRKPAASQPKPPTPKRGRGRPALPEDIKRFGYYSFATGGAKQYETLKLNFHGDNFPSLATARAFGKAQPSIREGVLQIEAIICSQDGVHAVVKAFGALRNNVLGFGERSASTAHLKSLLRDHGRAIVGISETEIEASKMP